MTAPMISARAQLKAGVVIPAHPLALTPSRTLDERRQRALTRYYMDAGAGGIAVGVHTTQFAIRDPRHGMYRPVLELAAETVRRSLAKNPRPFVNVAGLVGQTGQAESEAAIAKSLGYDVGLLSLAALPDATDAELIRHCRAVAEVIPLFGFYLQPAVGGRVLSYEFWREFAEIENVWAVKIAPFDRYRTVDAIRGIAESGRDDIALYTGNDDSIVNDLTGSFPVMVGGERKVRTFDGGLLGHWAVWTCWRDAKRRARREPWMPRCCAKAPSSPTRTPRYSIPRIRSRDAFPAFMKCCGVRAFSREYGVSRPRRNFRRGRKQSSTAWRERIRRLRMMRS